jgi:hypothetical protein
LIAVWISGNAGSGKEITNAGWKCLTEGKALVKADARLAGRIVEIEKIIRPPWILVQVFNSLSGKTNRQGFRSHNLAFRVSISA